MSHTDCYAKGLHAATPAGRALCRAGAPAQEPREEPKATALAR